MVGGARDRVKQAVDAWRTGVDGDSNASAEDSTASTAMAVETKISSGQHPRGFFTPSYRLGAPCSP
eukprot:3616229-Prymnesium_polylepis.2